MKSSTSESKPFQSRSKGEIPGWARRKERLSRSKLKQAFLIDSDAELFMYLRRLDWIFWEGYLPSLSINYVAMIKDMEKRLPQLYYIKMKISYDLGFIAIGVAMAT